MLRYVEATVMTGEPFDESGVRCRICSEIIERKNEYPHLQLHGIYSWVWDDDVEKWMATSKQRVFPRRH